MSNRETCAFDDELVFADELPPPSEVVERPPWKILVVDDEEVIHTATRIALADFRFDGRPLSVLGAFSAREGRALLEAHRDVAVVLLDVVMESDDAGLELARHVRETMRNALVRIVLRTGQPGAAPEKQVITQYDINDYREKTELTEVRLFTTLTAALRAYRDLNTIEKSRRGLELIVGSTGQLFADQRLRKFTEGVLTQLQSMLHLDEGSLLMQASGFAASPDEQDRLNIVAATGRFSRYVDAPVHEVVAPEMLADIEAAVRQRASVFTENGFVGYFRTDNGSVNVLYLQGCRGLERLEKDLIRTFSSNIAIAYDKLFLSREIQETQREVIEVLGSVVESRSNETASHVRRVAAFTHRLAVLAGLGEREATLLEQASPMHDVGKIAIPDDVLRKPGKLTEAEYALIKSHTSIGHAILRTSNRELMRSAAIIAHQHHERWDGRGYPQGLAGEGIHFYGRLVAIADVFDALMNDRVYRKALPLTEVVAVMEPEKGRQFDPELLQTFLDHLDAFVALNALHADDSAAGRRPRSADA
jgi:response regulator RpfG family c-di-GMP phosphodiesterase